MSSIQATFDSSYTGSLTSFAESKTVLFKAALWGYCFCFCCFFVLAVFGFFFFSFLLFVFAFRGKIAQDSFPIVAPNFCDGKFSNALSLTSAVALAKAHLSHGSRCFQCD